MNVDVLTTIAADGIAVITLGSARRITEAALARMYSYEEENVTSPSRSVCSWS
jgi:hypothetical protein